MWWALQAMPSRLRMPFMWVMQLTSQRTMASAPDCSALPGLGAAHGGADAAVLDGEEAAESTAVVGVGQVDDFEAFDAVKQSAGLPVDAELAIEMAAGMVGGFALQLGAGVDYAEDVYEEFGELEGDGCESFGLVGEVGLLGFLEDDFEKVACHGGAAAGGCDDGIDFAAFHEGREDREEAAGQFAGFVAIAGVEGGLTAAGLLFGEDDLDAVLFEELAGGDADAGVEHVDHTGDEEGDAFGSLVESGLVHGENQ